MGSNYRQDSYVVCPYYCKESPIQIKCSGLCGRHTIQEFDSKKEKEAFKEDFCLGYYWNCPCYRGLIENEV